MGNEVSRPQESSRSPYTPTSGPSRPVQRVKTNVSPLPSLELKNSLSPKDEPSLESPPNVNFKFNSKKERAIERMDKAIRSRVRGNLTYNMKLLIRGAKGTGKTSLFQRLKGEPIPETYQSTPQLQSATINWKFRQHLEETVKCEVWDIVDRGFVPQEEEEGATRVKSAATVERDGQQSRGSRPVGVAASDTPGAMQNGALVDASTVNVYHEAHGVIFLLDITKRETLEYVKEQLDTVPVHIPTLVLGNFRDQGAQRKIFKEDIQKMLYGLSDRPQQQQWRRPTELLYFECSLLNCYGLKSLHQYLGIPFLQLKLATIRRQMRIVEGEFTHLKHDVQATITEQCYADYVEHIKTSGSDIRTGRRTSGSGNTSPAVSYNNSVISSSHDICHEKLATQQENADKGSTENGARTAQIVMTTQTSQQEHNLPVESSSTVIQATPPHQKSMASIPDDATDSKVSKSKDENALLHVISSKSLHTSPSRARKAKLMEEVIHLEDFQVPKTRTSDLDHFYSEDDSDEDNGGNDEDVVVAPADGSMKSSISGANHKQHFLDSDYSDSEESESTGISRNRNDKATHQSPPHRRAPKHANTTTKTTIFRPDQSALIPPSSHSPPTALPSMQRTRLESPVRSQSSSGIKDSRGVPLEKSPKQHHLCGPTSDEAITSTHSATPPTSVPASLASPFSPRNTSENTSTASNFKTRVSVLQAERELKNESFSECTGTEMSDSSCDRESPQRSLELESTKNFSRGTYSSANDANDTAHISTTTSRATENNEMSASVTSMQYAGDNSINSEPVHDLHIQKNSSIEMEMTAGPANAGINVLVHDENEECNHNAAPIPQATEHVDKPHNIITPRPPQHHSQVRMSGDESDDGSIHSTQLPLSSLKASLPNPELSAPSTIPMLSNTEGVKNVTSQSVDDTMTSNLDKSGDSFSLSALQALLPLPITKATSPLSSIPHESTSFSDVGSDVVTNTALRLPDLETSSSTALASKPVVPGFTTVVPSNDLEAFLNESDSDLENGSPPDYAGLTDGDKQATKQQRSSRHTMVESSDDGDEEEDGQDRFASYSISKKHRSERRRQQRKDLLQLNAVFNMDNGPFVPSTSAVAVTDSPFVTSGVMEAIRKAQEDALHMLPTDPVPTNASSDSSLSRNRHTHKPKVHTKKKMRTARKRATGSLV